MKASILAKLMLPQTKRVLEDDRPPATPEGMRCLGCSHCGEMCDRVCHIEGQRNPKKRSSIEL